jgi:hypothetical protein
MALPAERCLRKAISNLADSKWEKSLSPTPQFWANLTDALTPVE